MATSYYSTGSVTLPNGSAVVTGNGTLWQTALITNGFLFVQAAEGNPLPIATVDSDNQITAELEWTGATGTYSYALLRQTDQVQDNAENSRALSYLISEMRNGTLFKYDVAGTLADRALYNERPKGFSYLVLAGSNAQLYVKASAASGDWAGPFAYGNGPVGPMGPAGFTNFRGTYEAGTTYVRNDGVYRNGSSYVALQTTTGNAPPNLPTTENAYWSLLAVKGQDGTGIGDMLKSVYDPQNRQLDVFAGLDSKDSKVVYSTKSAAYTAIVGDDNAVMRFTAAATLSLTAAAALAPGWRITVIADGGDVIIDPNGLETINGQAVLLVLDGTSRTITCDGLEFYAYGQVSKWETIGTYAPSGVAAVEITNLAAFRDLRISSNLAFTADEQLHIQFSTNNGSSYIATPDYQQQSLVAASNVSNANQILTLTGLQIGPPQAGGSNTSIVSSKIFNLNAATYVNVLSDGFSVAPGATTLYKWSVGGRLFQPTPRNALRIYGVNGSAMTGTITLEGIRG